EMCPIGRKPVKAPQTYAALERLGRVRLSRHFYLRNFLYSEIGNFYGLQNLPDDPELLIAAGTRLAEDLLEPLVETFGPVELRSAHRAPDVNRLGNLKGHSCAQNNRTRANHIWDQRDGAGRMGACATIVIPWFADRYNEGRDWRDLAFWLKAHLKFHEVYFFPLNAAFNLTWREEPEGRVLSYIAPKGLLADEANSKHRWRDFPMFRGLDLPV
ncbi:MAG: hypothetical protein AAGO57_02120, partial [Pseudomonadota bacterium]